eukprot:m.265920 g.265920  ORF g.265920 m.265920 type:complete len:140 (+) comp26762_c1_seq5:163-582(+)
MVTLHASHTLAMIQQLRIIWSQYVGYSESYVQSGMRETVTITTGSPACEVRCCATDPSINVRIEPYPRVPTTSIAAPASLQNGGSTFLGSPSRMTISCFTGGSWTKADFSTWARVIASYSSFDFLPGRLQCTTMTWSFS